MVNNGCPQCGGTQVAKGVRVGLSHEAGQIGLKHKPGMLQILVEPFQADVCLDCGTVVRLWVKEPKRKWLSD